MKIAGKVFFVTGAGGGIGGDLVAVLIERGAKVCAVDLRQEGLDELKNKVADSQALTVHTLDITDQKAVAGFPKIVEKDHGQVDGVINCAGIIQPFVKINNLELSDIEKVMNVNFYGTVYVTKAFLPLLLKRPEASVTNFSSMGGFLPVPGQGVYGASKAAVKLLTESLFAELLHTNVLVSVVFPGATKTNIAANSGIATPQGADTKKMESMTLPSRKAAEIVIDGIEKDKPQIFTGKDSKLMNKLYRLNPVYATKMITKRMQALLKD